MLKVKKPFRFNLSLKKMYSRKKWVSRFNLKNFKALMIRSEINQINKNFTNSKFKTSGVVNLLVKCHKSMRLLKNRDNNSNPLKSYECKGCLHNPLQTLHHLTRVNHLIILKILFRGTTLCRYLDVKKLE